jgi:hypothetical protein
MPSSKFSVVNSFSVLIFLPSFKFSVIISAILSLSVLIFSPSFRFYIATIVPVLEAAATSKVQLTMLPPQLHHLLLASSTTAFMFFFLLFRILLLEVEVAAAEFKPWINFIA